MNEYLVCGVTYAKIQGGKISFSDMNFRIGGGGKQSTGCRKVLIWYPGWVIYFSEGKIIWWKIDFTKARIRPYSTSFVRISSRIREISEIPGVVRDY